jgi:hypothetical protein
MPRAQLRNRGARTPRGTSARIPDRWTLLLPVLTLVVLNLPVLGLGYYWDDFYFLTFRGHGDPRAFLLPDPHADFYRPLPLGVYFKFLRFADPAGGLLAHVLSLAALAVALVLLVKLVSDLSGARAGLFAGLVFAGYGSVSSLVAWISCCQDLFAILFIAAAFLLRHRGRNLVALGCATAALLCKEPAVTAFPVLILWDWILGRPAKRFWYQVAAYTAIAVAWALVHPGIHRLAAHGFQSGSTQYVGLEHTGRWGQYLLRYLMTLVNLPPVGLSSSWLDSRALYGLAALVVVVAGLLYVNRYRRPDEKNPLKRVAFIGVLFLLPAALMPALLVRHWAPYFACIPAVGAAILLGAVLARAPMSLAVGVMALFLLLGARSRGVRGDEEWILSEPLMVEASQAVRSVRTNFRTLFPEFPRGSQVLASVVTRGLRGIQGALIDGQALSLWYRDPTLRTRRIMDRRPDATPEYLVRVTNDLDVIAFDIASGQIRSAMPGTPRLSELDPPIKSYARAAAAAGETDRAIGVIRGLSQMESGDLVTYNDRLIASMLLAGGREREADSILAVTPRFPTEVARGLVLRLLANPSPSEKLDTAAFEAFGLSASDPETIRWVMDRLWGSGALAQAAWYARQVQRLVPADRQAASILERAAELGIQPSRKAALHVAGEPGEDG